MDTEPEYIKRSVNAAVVDLVYQMKKDFLDLTGRENGDFRVIKLRSSVNGMDKWECQCVLCGGTKILRDYEFMAGAYHAERICSKKREAKKAAEQENPVVKKTPSPCGDRKGCIYWKRIDGSGPFCCNFIDINGVSRPRGQDGECLGYSRQEKGTNERKRKRDF